MCVFGDLRALSVIPLFCMYADYDDGDHEDNVEFRFISMLEDKVGVRAAKEYFDVGDRVRGLITLFRA